MASVAVIASEVYERGLTWAIMPRSQTASVVLESSEPKR